jgi:hypothetical protein
MMGFAKPLPILRFLEWGIADGELKEIYNGEEA